MYTSDNWHIQETGFITSFTCFLFVKQTIKTGTFCKCSIDTYRALSYDINPFRKYPNQGSSPFSRTRFILLKNNYTHKKNIY